MVTDEERFWVAAQWRRLEDDLPAVGVHPAWQEVLDQRTTRRIEAQVRQSLADGRRAVREASGQVVTVGGHRAHIVATCSAGVVLRFAAGYRECLTGPTSVWFGRPTDRLWIWFCGQNPLLLAGSNAIIVIEIRPRGGGRLWQVQ